MMWDNEDLVTVFQTLGYFVRPDRDDDGEVYYENFVAYFERTGQNAAGERQWIDSVFEVEDDAELICRLRTDIDKDGYIHHSHESTAHEEDCYQLEELDEYNFLEMAIGALEEFRQLHTLEHVRMGADSIKFIPKN